MTDFLTIDNGALTDYDVAVDIDGDGKPHQKVKVEFGADGTFTPVSASNPMPVSGPLTDTELRATAVPVSGPLTDTQLRATAVPVSGPLTDTQLRATAVPVSGPLTDVQLRATAVPVSGPLTDTELRATAVPVSGPLTDAQLRATVVPTSRDLKRIAVTSGGLTTATTAYTAGDQVGTQFTLTDAARVTGGTGIVVGVCLTSAADIIGAYDVVLLRNSITLAADNAAFSISDADALHVIGIVQLAGAFDIGANRIAQAFNLAIPYDTGSDANLYAALITRVGHTFFGATTDLQLQVFVERN